jgi:hypothetical protein
VQVSSEGNHDVIFSFIVSGTFEQFFTTFFARVPFNVPAIRTCGGILAPM